MSINLVYNEYQLSIFYIVTLTAYTENDKEKFAISLDYFDRMLRWIKAAAPMRQVLMCFFDLASISIPINWFCSCLSYLYIHNYEKSVTSSQKEQLTRNTVSLTSYKSVLEIRLSTN